ncbi:MAG: IS3 family transposase [Anaerolineales bacterium]
MAAIYFTQVLHREINKNGCKIGRYKVRRIMRQMGLKAKTPKRFKLTTDNRYSFTVAINGLIATLMSIAQTRSGQLISATYGPLAGCTWPLS